MKLWISAIAAVLGTLGVATAVTAQNTPIPVPTGPGGGAPIYVQPAPSPGTAPAPVEPADPAVTRPLPTAPAAEVGKDSRQRPRQLTSFPEMTRGVGNSQALLGE